ncbi:MAG TPA: hypothetical protein VH877_33900 [Polyangia bacterium]|jgi:hypothetical protein|nr:hypothetical protein [Polyangia bacterium]
MAMTDFTYPLDSIAAALPYLVPVAEGWRYENPQTGVEARVEGRTATSHAGAGADADAHGYLLRGGLPRPSFMGVELAARFGLGAGFLERWNESNRAATAQAGKGPRLVAEHGLAWWRYMTGKAALRYAWPSLDVGVLEPLLLQRKATGEVVRVLVWPESFAHMVLSEALDFVVLRPVQQMQAPGQRPSGLVPFAALRERLHEQLRRFEEPLPYWLYRGGEAHRFLMRSVRALEAEPARDFTAVRLHEVVDG